MLHKLSHKNGAAPWCKFLLLFALLEYSGISFAQETNVAQKNLIWHSGQCVEKHSGTTINSPSRIEVQAGVSVDMVIQDQVIAFSIETITGSWQNEEQDGSLEYAIKYDNTMPGKMLIKRTGGQTVITIDLTMSNPDGIHFEFFIDHVTNN